MKDDWLYYRIYPGDYVGCQALLAGPVPDLVKACRSLDGSATWFFLRFRDESGFHLRLRFHAELDALASLQRLCDTVLSGYPGEVRLSVYEPETAKYGGPAGVALAETLYQRTSDAVLDAIRADPAYWSRRLVYGAALTEAVLNRLPTRERQVFLHQYSWYWTGGQQGISGRARVRAAAARMAAAGPARRPTRWEPVGRMVADCAGGLDEALSASRRARLRVSDWHLTFHHLHLINNRLGVRPMEEALIAEYLRLSHQGEQQ